MKIKNTLRALPFYNSAKRIFYIAVRTRKSIYNFLFPTATILLYHRVADIQIDPNRLSIGLKNFTDQMRYLKKNYRIVSMLELADRIQQKTLERNMLAITFDDGYADNLHNALPILRELKIPVTVYVTVGKVDSPSPFFWDVNTISEHEYNRPLTTDELVTLANNPLIEIGSHTINHPRLATLKYTDQEQEISQSKTRLESLLKKSVVSFAYPFGGQNSFDQKTIEFVASSGYTYACSNIHERVRHSSHLHALPRFIVRDWDFDQFKKEMRKFI